MEAAWTLSADQVVKKLATDEHHGLDSAQVHKRQAKYGSNGNFVSSLGVVAIHKRQKSS